VSDAWYYADENGQQGPVRLQELRERLAAISDPENVLVWRDGFEDWQRAVVVPELKAQVSRPPPLPRGRPSAPAWEMRSAEAISTEQTLPKKWSLWRAALYGFLFGVFVFVISNAANGWNEMVWFHGRPGQIIGYFAGRFLLLPVVFVVTASIRNFVVKLVGRIEPKA
jgi:hypothetical protein